MDPEYCPTIARPPVTMKISSQCYLLIYFLPSYGVSNFHRYTAVNLCKELVTAITAIQSITAVHSITAIHTACLALVTLPTGKQLWSQELN